MILNKVSFYSIYLIGINVPTFWQYFYTKIIDMLRPLTSKQGSLKMEYKLLVYYNKRTNSIYSMQLTLRLIHMVYN
jgi:hypothetical protein